MPELTDDQLGVLMLGWFFGSALTEDFPVMLKDSGSPYHAFEHHSDEGYFILTTKSGLRYKVSVERME